LAPQDQFPWINPRWLESYHRRFIYKGGTSTHVQETDPRAALGAYGELPGIYLDAWGGVDAATSNRSAPANCSNWRCMTSAMPPSGEGIPEPELRTLPVSSVAVRFGPVLAVVDCKIPRKENSPIFRFDLCAPPVPVSPGSPELTRRLIKTSAPDKKIGLIKKL